MGKKKVENRYGVQVGDVFVEKSYLNDAGISYVHFYQVMRLRGETQVVLKRIHSLYTAFDLHDVVHVPVLGSWIEDAEELTRKVILTERTDPETKNVEKDIWVYIERMQSVWSAIASLYDANRQYTSSGFHYLQEKAVCSQFPELEQFDLRKGSGIFAVDQPFDDIYDDCPVVIRYPDGKEKQSNLKDLFDRDKVIAYRMEECRPKGRL